MDCGYRYARKFTLRLLGISDPLIPDEVVDYQPGDVFLGLDLHPQIIPKHNEYFHQLRNDGVGVFFVVYDLIPILKPEVFISGAREQVESWLRAVIQHDGAICISKSVADELSEWIKANQVDCPASFKIEWFHLGSDGHVPTLAASIDNPSHEVGMLALRPSFLMVGTLEPRKGHAQTLDAFERLWGKGIDINLVIVGKQGWLVDRLVNRLRNHDELSRRLFWLDGIDDEYLEKVYEACTCLIAASECEGFGLPLIEAARHKLPIIARDIPVFREVAGEHAYYFSGLRPEAIGNAIVDWLDLKSKNDIPQSINMPILTWEQSARQLLHVILPELAEKAI